MDSKQSITGAEKNKHDDMQEDVKSDQVHALARKTGGESYPQKQRRLQPYDYSTFGIPVEHLYKSPLGWRLTAFFRFEELTSLEDSLISLLDLDTKNYTCIKFEQNTQPTQPASICSLIYFLKHDGIGGIPLFEQVIQSIVVVHSQFLAQYNEKIREAHENRIQIDGLDENDLAVFCNYCAFNMILLHGKSKKKKKIVIKSSAEFTKWILIVKTGPDSYTLLARFFENPDRCLAFFTDDDIVNFFGVLEGRTSDHVENYNSIGSVNPGALILSSFEEFEDDDDE